MHNAYSPAVYYKHSFLFAHVRHLPDSMPPCFPEKPGSSPKSWIILWLVALGGGGGFPPPVFLCSLFSRLRSFLASPRIVRHFSLTSFDVLLATPSAFTLSFAWSKVHCKKFSTVVQASVFITHFHMLILWPCFTAFPSYFSCRSS